MASAQAQEKDVKEALMALAEEEQKHIVWLDELFNKIKDDPTDDFQLASLEDMPSPGIFTWDSLDRKELGLSVSVFWHCYSNGAFFHGILCKGFRIYNHSSGERIVPYFIQMGRSAYEHLC